MRFMKVVCARFNAIVGRIEVVREITNDDGTIEYNCLSLPTEKLESLSADYEIDDMNELVEIAIYESLIPVDDVHPDAQAARAQKRNRLANAKQRLGPMIANGNKEIVKTRLRDAGLPTEFVNAVDDDSLEVIKQNSRMDPIILQAKREFVQAMRRGEVPAPLPSRSMEARGGGTKNQVGDVAGPVKVSLPRISLRGGKRET